jgi:hypothetical protein
MKKIIITVILCLIIIPINSGFTADNPGPVIVDIDISQNLGEIPDAFRPGLMGVWSDKFNPLKTEVENLNKKPYWRLHFARYPDADSTTKPLNFEGDLKMWLNTVINPQLKLYQDAGYQLIITLTQVPKWLSLYPYDEPLPHLNGSDYIKWAYSPPNDYEEWGNFIRLLVQTQRDDGINADYIIGDEPDWTFYGTEEQYLEMYMHGANAIKDVDQNINVGGPGTGYWAATKYINCPAEATGLADGDCPPQDHTMIEALIEYVVEHNVPLDFIDWHFPDIYTLKEKVDNTRVLLKEKGLPETLPLSIGEWVFSSQDEDESTERASSYAVHMLKAFMDNGISRHSATSIYDQTLWDSGDWSHVGLFSEHGIIKARWNSFKAVDRLSGQRIMAETSDEDHVVAVSSKDNEVISVLFAHYMTQEEAASQQYEAAIQAGLDSFSGQSTSFIQTCFEGMADRQQTYHDLYSVFYVYNYLMQVLGMDVIESFFTWFCGSFPDYYRNDLISSYQIVYQISFGELPYEPPAREVDLNITNINPGTYTLRTYIIDGDMDEIHSNPCRYNKKTEPVQSDAECGVDGAVDQALTSAMESSVTAAIDYLASVGYSMEDLAVLYECEDNPECSSDSMTISYCEQNPIKCGSFKYHLNEVKNIVNNLFYYGSYTASSDETYTIPTYVGEINDRKEVSLEGSKQEKQITVTDGTYTEIMTVLPYSVVLIEIVP